MSIAIIANPIAGRGRSAKTADLTRNILTERNVDFRLDFTKCPGHASELAAKASENHETIVALGGDGTIREVLEGMWKTRSVLGVIPGGTGNDYARGFGIPRKTPDAIEVVLKQNIVPLDVGMRGSQIFGVLASIGFPVAVIEHVNRHRGGLFKGSLAILAGVVSTIRHLQSCPARITVDDRVFEENIMGFFVMNMPYGGGGLKFTPDAHYNNGVFDVFILSEISKAKLAFTLPKAYWGKHIPHPALTIIQGKTVKLESEPLPFMLDGDIFDPEPLQAAILPQVSRVIVPKAPAV